MVWINIKVDINATTQHIKWFYTPAGLTSDFTASQDVIGNMSWITPINSGGPFVYADATSDLIYWNMTQQYHHI